MSHDIYQPSLAARNARPQMLRLFSPAHVSIGLEQDLLKQADLSHRDQVEEYLGRQEGD